MTKSHGGSPSLTLAELGPDTEEQAGLSYLRLTDAAELTRATVGQTLLRVASERPDQPALMWLTETGVEEMTWAELTTKASAAAHELSRLSPARERVVVLGATPWTGSSLCTEPVLPVCRWCR